MHTISSIPSKLEALHEDSFGWAMCCCRYQREDAEEVLQMAYLKVLEHKAGYQGKSAFRTWLFAVIRNTAGDFYRKKIKRDRWLSAMKELPEIETETNRKTELIMVKLQQLPARQREVLHLVFYQDLTIQAAAEVMQVGLGTARTHYERGKQRLKQLLNSCKEELI